MHNWALDRRTAFYPICENDIQEPIELLKNHIEIIYFCDLKIPKTKMDIKALRNKCISNKLPIPFYMIGDAIEIMKSIKPVDIFFHRRDSGGEGGSELYLLSDDSIPFVLDIVKTGGLIVTDGLTGGQWYRTLMTRSIRSFKIGDRNLSINDSQPWNELSLTAFKID